MPQPASPTTHMTFFQRCASSSAKVISWYAPVSTICHPLSLLTPIWSAMMRHMSSLMSSHLPFRMLLTVPALVPRRLLAAFAWLGYFFTYSLKRELMRSFSFIVSSISFCYRVYNLPLMAFMSFFWGIGITMPFSFGEHSASSMSMLLMFFSMRPRLNSTGS